MMNATNWLHLVAGVTLFAALWFREAPVPASLRECLQWKPIWKQRSDFTAVGWALWLIGWCLLVLWMLLSIA